METRNYFLLMTIFFLVVSSVLGISAYYLNSMTAAAFTVLFLGITLYLSFHYIGHAGVDSLVGRFASAVTMPGERYKVAPEKFTPIEAKIISEDYQGAIDDLKQILDKYPGHSRAVAMLAEIFVDKLRDYPKAYGLLSVYFENKKKPLPGDEDLAMLFADVLLEMKAPDKADEFLQQEMKKPYSQSAIKAFSTRFNQGGT